MKKILDWIVYHPKLATIIILTLIAVSSVKIMNLTIDSSAEGLMVEGDPERAFYEDFKKTFGSDNLTVVSVKSLKGDVFNEKTLKLIDELTNQFSKLEGVTKVTSLVTVNKIKGENDSLNTDKLITNIPNDEADLDTIRKDTMMNYIFVKNIISSDGKATAININTENRNGDINFNTKISTSINNIIDKHKGNHEIYQIGTPLIKVTFSSYIAGDQKTLIPLAVILIMITLALTFRSPIAMMLPMITGGLSVMATFAFMTLMGYPINVLTAIVPVLLIAIGCTEDVHMISEYLTAIKEGKTKIEALLIMAGHSALPITITSSTTIIGFASLIINDITILKQFGAVAGFGLAANFIITITLIPSCLTFFNIPAVAIRERDAIHKQSSFLDRLLKGIININENYGNQILIVTAIIVVLSIYGATRLEVNTDFISYFKENTDIRKRIKDMHETMSGAMGFSIVVDTKKADGAKDPELLNQIAGLQRFIEKQEMIDKTISLADYMMLTNREMNDGKKEMLKIPDSSDLVAQYMLIIGEDDLKQYVNNDYSKLHIMVRHNLTSSSELTKVLKAIQGYIDENLSKDLVIKFTGEGILINNAADSMVINEIYSLLSTIVIIFFIMSGLFMSFKAGFVSMIPNIIPIFFNFGIMTVFNLPLNTGTCMVSAIAIGIAVDDTVHFMVRYHKELMKTNSQKDAINNTLIGEGEAVLSSSFALTLGFGILMLSNFNPTIHFGLLASLTMIMASLMDLFLSPIILTHFQFVTIWDLVSLKLDKEVTKKSPLFVDFTHSQAKKVMLMGSIKKVAKGDYLIKQGDIGNEMYMVVTGQVEVVHSSMDDTTKSICMLKQGALVGEMALLAQGLRFTNVIAFEDSELLTIDEKALKRIQRRYPWIASKLFLNIAKILTDRLGKQIVDKTIVIPKPN